MTDGQAPVIRDIIGALQTWGPVACVAGLEISVTVWAVANQQGKYAAGWVIGRTSHGVVRAGTWQSAQRVASGVMGRLHDK